MEHLKAEAHPQGLLTSQVPDQGPTNHRLYIGRTSDFFHLLMRDPQFLSYLVIHFKTFLKHQEPNNNREELDSAGGRTAGALGWGRQGLGWGGGGGGGEGVGLQAGLSPQWA